MAAVEPGHADHRAGDRAAHRQRGPAPLPAEEPAERRSPALTPDFAPGYENHRISVTLLFGHHGSGERGKR